MDKPLVLGITMGDPGGIGPEIIIKALSTYKSAPDNIKLVVLGDMNILEAAARSCSSDITFNKISNLSDPYDNIGVVNLTDIDSDSFTQCDISIDNGAASITYVEHAVKLAMNGEIDAIVTAPISKAAIKLAGCTHAGHTGLLAEKTGAKRHVMMLAGKKLRVALITTHMPLKSVPEAITAQKVMDTVEVTDEALKELYGFTKPKIALAALNPHAGEEGTLGDEEINVLSPAVEQLQEKGIDVSGPFPADSLYFKAARGAYDAVVSPYHDQGLVALKLIHFEDGVNITLGLPIIRTSVDHGTAFDIAWTNKAEPTSMISAIELAKEFAINKKMKNAG